MSLYYLLALAVGVLLPLQAAINNDLRGLLHGNAMLATFVSFAVGALASLLLYLAAPRSGGGLGVLSQASWWQLSGGVLGVIIVCGSIVLAPRIGLAAMSALIVAGQILASLLFDRMGFLGLQVRDINPSRLLGALLVFAGVVLVNGGFRR